MGPNPDMVYPRFTTPKSSKRNHHIRNVAPQKPRFLSIFGLPHSSNLGFLRSLAWPGLGLAGLGLGLAGLGLGLAGLGLAWPALLWPGLAWHWPGLTKKPAPDDPRFPYPFLRNRLGHGPPP